VPRKIGWEDESITGRFRDKDDVQKFRGAKGVTFVIRVMTDCEEYRVHAIDDILDPGKDGEPRVFNMLCSKTWDDENDDWDGDCVGCDREYDVATKYIAGVLVVGQYKGRAKKVQKNDAENAPHFWDFGGDKYRKLSDIALELSRAEKPKKLQGVELTVKCEDEHYQKLNINVSQAARLTTKEHVTVWKEEGQKLIDDAIKAPSLAEQKRTLKKRKKKRSRDDDGGDEEEKPRRRKAKKEKDEEPEEEAEEEEDTGGDEDLDDLLDELG